MLQKTFKEEALSRAQVFECLRRSNEEKSALKIILVLGALQQVVPTRMSKQFDKKSMRIVGT